MSGLAPSPNPKLRLDTDIARKSVLESYGQQILVGIQRPVRMPQSVRPIAQPEDSSIAILRPSPKPKEPTREEKFRLHWMKAHKMPLAFAVWVEAEVLAALKEWRATIPSSCGCLRHWDDLVVKHPVDASSPVKLARWFWQRHNDVNARLRAEKGGHPDVSWEACCKLYEYPQEWIVDFAT